MEKVSGASSCSLAGFPPNTPDPSSLVLENYLRLFYGLLKGIHCNETHGSQTSKCDLHVPVSSARCLGVGIFYWPQSIIFSLKNARISSLVFKLQVSV